MGKLGTLAKRLPDQPGRSATAEFRRARSAARRWGLVSGVCGALAAVGLVLAGWRGVPWLFVLAAGIALVGWAVRPDPDVDRWRRGAEAEEATALLLSRLPRRYAIFHDRQVPGSRANLDHLVVGPTGVWVIDTKTRTGRYPIDTGPVAFEAGRVAATLDVEAVPLIALHGCGLGPRGKVVDEVRILPAERLCRWIRRGSRQLDRYQVAILTEQADRAFPPA